jgi:hypothetical protein
MQLPMRRQIASYCTGTIEHCLLRDNLKGLKALPGGERTASSVRGDFAAAPRVDTLGT